jgi:hypothetical protein
VAIARQNLRGTIVQVHHGRSVTMEEASAATLDDEWLQNPPEHVAVDTDEPAAYLGELAGTAVENEDLLRELLPLERPLICLDSAGSVGLLEFEIVTRVQPAPYLLFLDDVNHVKHHRSMLAIERAADHWTVLGKNMADGWLIAERHALPYELGEVA